MILNFSEIQDKSNFFLFYLKDSNFKTQNGEFIQGGRQPMVTV